MFENSINELKDEIISKASRLIQIPSVYEESLNLKKPFGENVNKALEYMLSLGEELGFRTKNIDGYCGYIEFGEGKELVGIIGHLDVVPVNEGWTHDPFAGIVQKGKLYGRGAIDDKGPVIAALYAMKVVMENAKINKRVRLILGLNEETHWRCINYYKEHEEWPVVSFSPDSDFPCIYAEKGFLSVLLHDDYSEYLNEPLILEDIDCKSNAINVVAKECSATVKINSTQINIDSLIECIKNSAEKFKPNIKIEQIDNYRIKVTSYGIAAHAARPQNGDNAISKLLVLLYEAFSYFHANVGILHLFNNYINTEYNGEKLGLNLEDESGKLTINVGTVCLEENMLRIGLNIRVPVNTKLSVITDKLTNIASTYKKIKVETIDLKQPLYVPKDSFLVTTLLDVFNRVTGLNEKPVAIGGATYARAFDNCVAFGANMPGHKDMCHQVDEYIEIDNLILASKIYAEAIYELVK